MIYIIHIIICIINANYTDNIYLRLFSINPSYLMGGFLLYLLCNRAMVADGMYLKITDNVYICIVLTYIFNHVIYYYVNIL